MRRTPAGNSFEEYFAKLGAIGGQASVTSIGGIPM